MPILDDAASSMLQFDSSAGRERKNSTARNETSTAQEQLRAKGFISIQWHGKCEADKVSMGTYAIPPGQGGMYGLIFDNTFSKQFSKTATFVLLTYPSNAPPHSTHHLQQLPPTTGTPSIGKSQSPRTPSAQASDSVDSLHSHLAPGNDSRSRGNSVLGRNDSDGNVTTYHVGVLSKRRRKRGQGYARRFFSLDFQSCTLSYYYSRNSSALRGAIPLSLAAIAADERRREISIDSGAEVWHLKAGNARDFDDWTRALEKASNSARGVMGSDSSPSPELLRVRTTKIPPSAVSSHDEEQEWEQVEALVSRIVGTRDAVRRLSKDTAPGAGKRQSLAGLGIQSGPASSSPGAINESGDYFGPLQEAQKRPFWKRKVSSTPSTPQMLQRNSQLHVPAPTLVTTISAAGQGSSSSSSTRRGGHRQSMQEENNIHDHCTSLLHDLDKVLAEFSTLLTKSKRRRMAAPKSATSRHSFDSTSTAEFFDAEPGKLERSQGSQVLMIDHQSDEQMPPSEAEDEFITDASSLSSAEAHEPSAHLKGSAALFPVKPKTLDPLPINMDIKRRKAVPAATVPPPSLIGFVRKNVGKDLSTISMPVSANEPTSLLQRVAEQMEYSQLLDSAASHKSPDRRLLYVTAFAVSQLSMNRAKERAVRKPFNPMLGETYELVRTESEHPGGMRLLVEKVCHRPVRMAIQADSVNWSLSQSPAPSQKFWGKSAELITEGRVRVVLHLAGGGDELYSWNVSTQFLRNIVMGEKYVEPVGGMSVINETSSAKATVEFKTKGMFGGRSEDVEVETFGADGAQTGVGLVGNWTSSLKIRESGKAGAEIWRVGELVSNSAQTYGLTTFAASLNEITEIEKGKIPPTDSRLRPDQRAHERGDLDDAEIWKTKLEEKQRVRRKEKEDVGEAHRPRWFVRVEGGDEGEEVWKLRSGKEGYWEERAKGSWTGVEDILSLD